MSTSGGARDTAAARNVDDIAHLERAAKHTASLGERISVAITSAAGTPASALIHAMVFGSWMLWNSLGPTALRYDPFPFALLTMAVSMEGVVLAVLILITQNRMSLQTDRRDQLNLQVDLLAEQEMTLVLRLLHRISERLGAGPESSERDEAQRLMQPTNIHDLMEALEKKLK
jgi:uncharacterized membrane protein